MPGERFHVRLLPEEGGGSGERVVAEVGLEGFNIMDSGGSRVMKKYPLHHISRWSMRGTSLILFTRSPVSARGSAGGAGEAASAGWQRVGRQISRASAAVRSSARAVTCALALASLTFSAPPPGRWMWRTGP